MNRIAIIALIALSGCSSTTVYEASVGYNTTQLMPWSRDQSGGFNGPKDVVRFSVRQESRDGRKFCGYSHISHLSAGYPFNDRAEDWLDMVECGVRIRGNSF